VPLVRATGSVRRGWWFPAGCDLRINASQHLALGLTQQHAPSAPRKNLNDWHAALDQLGMSRLVSAATLAPTRKPA
jgi:hypothetical protein